MKKYKQIISIIIIITTMIVYCSGCKNSHVSSKFDDFVASDYSSSYNNSSYQYSDTSSTGSPSIYTSSSDTLSKHTSNTESTFSINSTSKVTNVSGANISSGEKTNQNNSSSKPVNQTNSDNGSSKSGNNSSVSQVSTAKYPLSDPTNKGGWTVYEPMTDEFEGTQLDPNKWVKGHHYWDGRIEYFAPQNVNVKNGKLILTMQYKPEDIPDDKKAQGYNSGFTGACVSSAKTNNNGKVRYGYFEVKAKMADECCTSSFWFQDPYSSGYEWGQQRGSEIDVFECIGKSKIQSSVYDYYMPINTHAFSRDWKNDHATPYLYKTPSRVADAFNVYGLEWLPDKLNFYYNGKLIHTEENKYQKYPQYMFFDMEIFAQYQGIPDKTMSPANYEIEYVRSWKNEITK